MVNGKILMSLVMLAIFAGMVGMAMSYPYDARLLPFVIGIPGCLLALIQVGVEVTDARRQSPSPLKKVDFDTVEPEAPAAAEESLDPSSTIKLELTLLAYMVGLAIIILLLGFWLAIPIFVTLFLRFHEKESWRFTLALAAGALGVLYFIFEYVLSIFVHKGFLVEYLIG